MTRALRRLPAAAVLLLVFAAAGQAAEGHATARVRVDVGPVVAVGAGSVLRVTPLVGGKVEAEVGFRVSANMDRVYVQCFASDLFKAGYPGSPYRIGHDGGVLVSMPAASPVHGGSPFLAFVGPAVPGTGAAAGFLLYPTESRQWESAFLSFSHDVTASFSWRGAGELLPRGEYAGYVKFLAYRLDP